MATLGPVRANVETTVEDAKACLFASANCKLRLAVPDTLAGAAVSEPPLAPSPLVGVLDRKTA